MLYITYFTIKPPFVWQDILLLPMESHFININADNATNNAVGSEEVLRRLKFLVATIQTWSQNAALKSDHSWWPLSPWTESWTQFKHRCWRQCFKLAWSSPNAIKLILHQCKASQWYFSILPFLPFFLLFLWNLGVTTEHLKWHKNI
jgi:hypothetical protein